MDFFRSHLLSIITYTPLVGALVLLLPFFKGRDRAVRWTANVVGSLGFLVRLGTPAESTFQESYLELMLTPW